MRALRIILDGLYRIGGYLAGFFLLAILVAICVQVLARWIGVQAPGSQAYAGYFMAASAFFALAFTFGEGGHIRVGLFLNALGEKRRLGEVFCLTIGSLVTGYFAWFAVKGTIWSHKFHEVSQGQDATPLWIPQVAMAAGTTLLFISVVDSLIQTVFFHKELEDLDDLESHV